jgi:hypothetical protein
MTDYLIGATLKVTADNLKDAKERASAALISLAGRADITGAWIDKTARLFDADAFWQIPGQMDMGTD